MCVCVSLKWRDLLHRFCISPGRDRREDSGLARVEAKCPKEVCFVVCMSYKVNYVHAFASIVCQDVSESAQQI